MLADLLNEVEERREKARQEEQQARNAAGEQMKTDFTRIVNENFPILAEKVTGFGFNSRYYRCGAMVSSEEFGTFWLLGWHGGYGPTHSMEVFLCENRPELNTQYAPSLKVKVTDRDSVGDFLLGLAEKQKNRMLLQTMEANVHFMLKLGRGPDGRPTHFRTSVTTDPEVAKAAYHQLLEVLPEYKSDVDNWFETWHKGEAERLARAALAEEEERKRDELRQELADGFREEYTTWWKEYSQIVAENKATLSQAKQTIEKVEIITTCEVTYSYMASDPEMEESYVDKHTITILLEDGATEVPDFNGYVRTVNTMGMVGKPLRYHNIVSNSLPETNPVAESKYSKSIWFDQGDGVDTDIRIYLHPLANKEKAAASIRERLTMPPAEPEVYNPQETRGRQGAILQNEHRAKIAEEVKAQ